MKNKEAKQTKREEKGSKNTEILNCGRVNSSNNSFKKCDRIKFTLAWFIINFKEAETSFTTTFEHVY